MRPPVPPPESAPPAEIIVASFEIEAPPEPEAQPFIISMIYTVMENIVVIPTHGAKRPKEFYLAVILQ